MATTTTTSKQFTLNWSDAIKGLTVAILAPVIAVIITALEAGSLSFDWYAIKIVALSSGLGYIVKNFLTPSAIVVKDVSKETVEAVKDGDATVTVTPH